MNKLSVVIITFNEEKNIDRCIDSVKLIADEVIVLDSFSTDATIYIASKKGAIIHQQTFNGYINQKNKAIKLATNNYVLSLDADEAVSDELAASIAVAKKSFDHKAYQMNRCNIYCGQQVRHGLWYPDRKLRLFDKRIGVCGGLNPHDRIMLSENCKVHQLKGDLLHYTYQSFNEYMVRNDEVSTTAAESLFSSGKKVHWSKIFFSPVWAFVNGYFLKLGFLDGRNGLIIAIHTAGQSYKKYFKLKQLQKKAVGKIRWQNVEF